MNDPVPGTRESKGVVAPSADGGQQLIRLLINIDVDDLENGVRFYEDGLGFRPGRRLFDGTVAELHGASSTIYLLETAGESTATPEGRIRRDFSRHWTPVHLDLEVEDIERAVSRAVDAGADLEGGVRAFPWGRLATLSDPFGHGFCLLQFHGEGYEGI